MARVVDFYLDYISPYAYLGWHRGLRVAREHELELRCRPLLFAALLDHHGQRGPAEIEAKRRWLFEDVIRQCRREDLPLTAPHRHPFNSLLPLRVTLAASEAVRPAVTTALFDLTWGRGLDVTDPTVLRAALEGIGLDGEALLAAATTPAVKEALKQSTTEAIARGVFGVPTLHVEGRLLWGSDQWPTAVELLEGRDVVEPALREAFLALRPGSVRPGSVR